MVLRSYKLLNKDPTQAIDSEIGRFLNDERIPLKNRKIAVDWLNHHRIHLDERYDNLEERKANAHKTFATVQHLCMLLRNLSLWLDFSNITEKNLTQFKHDFFELKDQRKELLSIKGKRIKSQREYMTKLIRSDFFRNYLGLDKIVSKVFNNKIKDKKPTVEYITLDELKKMVKYAPQLYQKLVLYLLFSTGMRIGCLLNMKKRDFENQYNSKTKVSYYLCHIKKEYLKGSDPEDVTLPIVIPECNELLKEHLATLKSEDFIVPVSYGAVRALLDKVTTEAKIRTHPNNKKPTIHILRKSAALHLLNQGYSLDQVKSFLAHKPSSTAIDCYVTYKGLKFEPEVTKVQTDELLTLQKTLKDNEMQMAQMQKEIDDLKEVSDEKINNILKKKKFFERLSEVEEMVEFIKKNKK